MYRLTWRLPLAGLVAFSHLQFSQIRGRQPYLIVRNILYVIHPSHYPDPALDVPRGRPRSLHDRAIAAGRISVVPIFQRDTDRAVEVAEAKRRAENFRATTSVTN